MENEIAFRVLDLMQQTQALPFELRMRLVDQSIREWQADEKRNAQLDRPSARR